LTFGCINIPAVTKWIKPESAPDLDREIVYKYYILAKAEVNQEVLTQ